MLSRLAFFLLVHVSVSLLSPVGGEGGGWPRVLTVIVMRLQVDVRKIRREGSVESEVSGLCVVDSQLLPVEQLGESLRPVPHDDSLPPRQLAEVEHDLCQVRNALLHRAEPSVHHVYPVTLRLDHVLLYEAAEAREVGSDGGDPHDGALGRGVAPRLVVAWEHSQVTATDKLLVTETQQGIVVIEELWVEDNLDSVLWIVEQVTSLKGRHHGVLVIVLDTVSCYWRPEHKIAVRNI